MQSFREFIQQQGTAQQGVNQAQPQQQQPSGQVGQAAGSPTATAQGQQARWKVPQDAEQGTGNVDGTGAVSYFLRNVASLQDAQRILIRAGCNAQPVHGEHQGRRFVDAQGNVMHQFLVQGLPKAVAAYSPTRVSSRG
jgi:hypothetical protein